MSRMYAIDPGLTGTGWAEWLNTDTKRIPSRAGVFRHQRDAGLSLATRCKAYADDMRTAVKQGGGLDEGVRIFIEMPQMMRSSAKGIAAQAGGIYKLTFMVGYLAAWLWPCTVIEVNPIAWKGQLPKDIVQGRIERIIGKNACAALGVRTHAWDAVGLGLWAMGLLGE